MARRWTGGTQCPQDVDHTMMDVHLYCSKSVCTYGIPSSSGTFTNQFSNTYVVKTRDMHVESVFLVGTSACAVHWIGLDWKSHLTCGGL